MAHNQQQQWSDDDTPMVLVFRRMARKLTERLGRAFGISLDLILNAACESDSGTMLAHPPLSARVSFLHALQKHPSVVLGCTADRVLAYGPLSYLAATWQHFYPDIKSERLHRSFDKQPDEARAHLCLPRATLDLSRPRLMAILNVTPDSFFDGGRYQTLDRALERADLAIGEGADVLDVGGESSRPGANRVSEEVELERVIPVIRALCDRCPIPISIDTTRASVARAAFDEGAQIINDISGLRHDPQMIQVARDTNMGLVLMHMRGFPATMHEHREYRSVVGDVLLELAASVDVATNAGLDIGRLLVDPGIGFAKTAHQNLEILRDLALFDALECPLLIGVSRKSFLGQVLNVPAPDRLIGSVTAAAASVMQGASMVRVHDVRETRQMLDTLHAMRS